MSAPGEFDQYSNPWHAAAVQHVVERFGIEQPTIYYPGSYSDKSLAQTINGRVIHVDQSDLPVGEMQQAGFEAYEADAHDWVPPVPVDIVFLANPSGIDADRVLKKVPLNAGAKAVWMAWWGPPGPKTSLNRDNLVGVVQNDGEKKVKYFDATELDGYYAPKDFEELTVLELQQMAFKLKRANRPSDLDTIIEGIPVAELRRAYQWIGENVDTTELKYMYKQPKKKPHSYGAFVFELM